MPAVSQAQQRFMGWVHGNPEQAAAEGIHIPDKVAKEYASTPRAGLPKRVAQPRKRKYYGE